MQQFLPRASISYPDVFQEGVFLVQDLRKLDSGHTGCLNISFCKCAKSFFLKLELTVVIWTVNLWSRVLSYTLS